MILLLVIVECGNNPGEKNDISHVESWAYQLQKAIPEDIVTSGFELIVMDYSLDGTEEKRYSLQDIEKIKNGGVIPIAYLSIGEAEEYRFYWKEDWSISPPAWLGNKNPEWEGNYKVKYWYDEWKKVIYEYLDRIIEQGFMGVYLDVVDAFEYWSDSLNGEDTFLLAEDAAKKMIDFVEEIAQYCRDEKNKEDFYIIPQNGERILQYDTAHNYLHTISGIGIESLWYDGVVPVSSEERKERISYIDKVVSIGKPVFSVDYVDDGTGYKNENRRRIDDYRTKALSKGYIPYVARLDRRLDELNIIPGIQP